MASEHDAEWDSYIATLAPIGRRLLELLPDPDDAYLRQELYQALFGQIASGYLALWEPDPRYPDFWPFTSTGMKPYLNNPDTDYYVTPIDGDGTYQISGFRGTVHKLDFSTGDGTFLSRGNKDDVGIASGLFDIDQDANVGPDGAFEVILSPTRPQGWTGGWWELPAGSKYLLVRQWTYDWVNEISGRFAIDRLDVPAGRPPRTIPEIETDLKQIAVWAEGHTQVSIENRRYALGAQGSERINRLETINLGDYGYFGHLTQFYVHGGWDLQPDEAFLIETDVPDGLRYWSIHLANDLCFTLDWANRHTSVNGHTAVIDDDGKFRVVISAEDPGVPNWLDTISHRTGTISLRWMGCATPPDSYQFAVVKTADVRAHLPAATPKVTPEQRDTAIRARRRGVQLRKRW
ncbi:MAG TPA: DUF1214 domain-containing protein [Streptosporangiaceae bacterium]|jgi:hypothetical protein|nr:DUF1214 domain-containing protein [Streptosporangiaceae bacterium]